MPRGDGTGPMRIGRMTGRGAGFCADFAATGYANFGRGSRTFRFGRGFRHWQHAGYTITDEKGLLNKQAEFLENQLKQVKERISSLNDVSQ